MVWRKADNAEVDAPNALNHLFGLSYHPIVYSQLESWIGGATKTHAGAEFGSGRQLAFVSGDPFSIAYKPGARFGTVAMPSFSTARSQASVNIRVGLEGEIGRWERRKQ